MANVIVCPDGFKGTFAARAIAAAIAAGVREAGLDALELPLADGGEGTLEALLAGGGERRTATVAGPLGDPVEAAFGLLDGGRVDPAAAAAMGLAAVIEAPTAAEQRAAGRELAAPAVSCSFCASQAQKEQLSGAGQVRRRVTSLRAAPRTEPAIASSG